MYRNDLFLLLACAAVAAAMAGTPQAARRSPHIAVASIWPSPEPQLLELEPAKPISNRP